MLSRVISAFRRTFGDLKLPRFRIAINCTESAGNGEKVSHVSTTASAFSGAPFFFSRCHTGKHWLPPPARRCRSRIWRTQKCRARWQGRTTFPAYVKTREKEREKVRAISDRMRKREREWWREESRIREKNWKFHSKRASVPSRLIYIQWFAIENDDIDTIISVCFNFSSCTLSHILHFGQNKKHSNRTFVSVRLI